MAEAAQQINPFAQASEQSSQFDEAQRQGDAPGQGDRSGIDRRRHERFSFETTEQRSKRVKEHNDRRRHERREMDRLRSELNYVTTNSSRHQRSSFNTIFGIKRSRFLLLGIALLCGGSAAFLAAQAAVPPAPEVRPIETNIDYVHEERVPVLVASQPISVGQRMSANVLSWQEWPVSSVHDDYVTADEMPEADQNLDDAVARFALFAGDPIRQDKLVRDADGYLSAVLTSGTRAVSVSITPDLASGGFINPNDRVDVILTREGQGEQLARAIVRNVRVLAIDDQLGTDPNPDVEDETDVAFTDLVNATLELDSYQTDTVIGAQSMGRLTLVLRAAEDETHGSSSRLSGLNQTIRLTSPFWNPAPNAGARN